ncbi:MAG: type I methionyl aminopeptidase [Armatimonadetes bacterium]|nr:type I methionyl aminopeptidase [Armatimonadota bacterium]
MIVLKTAEDLDRMRRAGQLAARALEAVTRAARSGVSTAALDRIAEEFIRRHRGIPSFKNYRGFPKSICTSVDEEVVHGIPGPRVLQAGEIVSIDLGVLLDGFHADVAKTVPVGDVSPPVRRLLEVAEEALARGIAEARPGARLGDVSWAIQAVVEAAGFSAVRDFAGHGIGRQLHEDPQVPNVGRPGTGSPLVVGMTLAIEPMVNMGGADVVIEEDGWTVRTRDRSLSAHAEHTVAITPDGPEILTGRNGAGTIY